jgi:molecular chaperone GrpE
MAEQTKHNPEAAPETDAPEGVQPEATAEEAAQAADSDAVAGEAAPAEDGDTDLTLRVAELEAERDELKKRLMYALADTENIRKRAERDRRDAETFGGQRLARDLLSVHDNLERAVAAIDDDLRVSAGAVMEGVELTQRELLSAFAKHKIEKLVPEKGETFDPNFHQAMFEAPVPGAPNGTIIEVMQSGFTIAGRILRPALVGVAKGGAAAPAPETDGSEP